ncbi:hypothetical protein DENIS_4545 [Desulfonema ishimotonii]|uniref:HTH marR-type domain-containing protein n=1 Tax=Desulfonema ishimotonii TaxID=45657 RepID=A0A401G2U4_9BACT|nr:hypothetical protein [Desulfonema ishimotonii]GBC63547.1 hypothetical protein DENIS_4545 [Desulfonema ishimotonii]
MVTKPTYEELEERVRALEKTVGEMERISPSSEHEETGSALLTLLADEWDQAGPPGIVDIRQIREILGISADEMKALIGPLYAKGAVDMDRRGRTAFLTPEGYDMARASGE